MKNTIGKLITSCILLISFGSKAEKSESVPVYTITKVIEDKSLNTTEALFVFTCKDPDGMPLSKEIIYSYKGKNVNAKSDSNGKFSIKTETGKYVFQFYINYKYEEIRTDSIVAKGKTRTEITLHFSDAEQIRPMKKPVIYLYPEKKIAVNVQLNLKGELGFTYPTYTNGWNVVASPNGDLTVDNKTYGYLFWEGNAKMEANVMNEKEGFVVGKDSLLSFFENSLEQMGLSSKESEDFITYWVPLMQANEKVYIHFLFKEELANYAALRIDPVPDNLFRVFMLWQPHTGAPKSDLKPQKLPNLQRNGFTVLEWGGTEWTNSAP